MRFFMFCNIQRLNAERKGERLDHIHVKCGYSHLSNSCGGWNNRGGGAKVAKSINVEVGIYVEGGFFGKN